MSADPVRNDSYWELINCKWFIEDWLPPVHLSRRREQRALLAGFGFRRFVFTRRMLLDLLVWALAVALVAGIWLLHYAYKDHAPNDYATAIVALVGFVVGYYQWRSSRYEKAMEDFYSRLDLANGRREKSKLVPNLLGHPWNIKGADEYTRALRDKDEEFQWSTYVYSELDNLEYVVEKYNLGYMQPQHALRGLRTFYQRCIRPAFRERALKCARCMAYNESTVRVVKRVCEDIENRRKATQPRRSQSVPVDFEDRRTALRPRRSQEVRSALGWRDLTDKAALLGL